jgi:energy-coupling factor transport system permease protein
MAITIPYTVNPSLYGVTFRGLGLPDRFAYAMDLAFRFVPTLGRDFSITLDAQRARGYEVEKVSGGLIAQIRKLAPLIVPVTINAIVGAEDIIDAMDLRAFGIGARTWVHRLTYQRRDKILIALSVLVFAGSTALSFADIGKLWVPQTLLRLAAG